MTKQASTLPTDTTADAEVDAPAYTYDPAQNPDNAFLPGVPLRDLTDADLADLPKHLRAGVAACPFYRARA